MTTTDKLERKFWATLTSDMTVMLSLAGVDDAHARPMTAQLEGEQGPLWFFTSMDTELVRLVGHDQRAVATFAAKGHELFATIHGRLSINQDRATIDRLWNRFVAAWYEGGKEDPTLVLLRMDLDQAEIWLNETSLLAGVKLLLGIDPKRDYKDKVAKIAL